MRPRDRLRLIKLRGIGVDWHRRARSEPDAERAQVLGACAKEILAFVDAWEAEIAKT